MKILGGIGCTMNERIADGDIREKVYLNYDGDILRLTAGR